MEVLKRDNARLLQLQSLNDARFEYLKSKPSHANMVAAFDDAPTICFTKILPIVLIFFDDLGGE